MDWSISAGIFIIYILALFILVTPAFKQYTAQEYLGSIVKDGVKESLSLELKRFPFFLSVSVDSSFDVNTEKKFKTNNNLPSELLYLNIEDTQIGLFNESLSYEITEKDYYIINHNEIKFIGVPSSMGITSSEQHENQIVKLWIFLSGEEIFDLIAYGEASDAEFNHTFGISETISGIYQQKLDDFLITDYAAAKTNFNYPEDKDFVITIYEGTDLAAPPIFTFPLDLIPQEKDTVSTLVWSDWLITYDNTQGKMIQRNPITIVVRTW